MRSSKRSDSFGFTYCAKIDVRVLAANHKDLRTLVNRGLFREDLYYRLAQATVQIPSPGERKDDIPQPVQHFLSELPAATSALAARRRRVWS